jgi:hypothetical protein
MNHLSPSNFQFRGQALNQLSPSTPVQFHKGQSMSKKPIYKPVDPAVVALSEAEKRGDPAKWGVNEDNLRLAANSEVTVEGETRTNVKRAMRWDVFAMMLSRKAITRAAHDAIRRLQRDLAILHRTQGASDAIRTIGSIAPDPGGMSVTRIEAGERIRYAIARLPTWQARMLIELAGVEAVDGRSLADPLVCLHTDGPTIIRSSEPNWQKIVRRHTGEINRLRMADRLREAAEALASTYVEIDNEPRRAMA